MLCKCLISKIQVNPFVNITHYLHRGDQGSRSTCICRKRERGRREVGEEGRRSGEGRRCPLRDRNRQGADPGRFFRLLLEIGIIAITRNVDVIRVCSQTSVPVPSPGAGVIKELFVKDGDTVKPGQKLCTIDIGATGGATAAPAAKAPQPAAAPPPPKPAAQAPPPTPAAPPPSAAPPPRPAAPIPPPAAQPRPPQAPTTSMPVAAIKHAQVINQ